MQRADPGRPSCRGKPRPRGEISARPDRGGALILGAVIAGGQSRRFGSDKAVAALAGTALIDHAIAAIAPFVRSVVVSGRSWGGYPTLSDHPAAGLGPLGGIAAALDYARAGGDTAVLSIGCDMPHVPADLLSALIAAAPSYCADAPILGVWPVAALPGLDIRLRAWRSGDRKAALAIRGWAEDIGATPISASAALPNINTPDDLLAL